jgi:hypothetical protein
MMNSRHAEQICTFHHEKRKLKSTAHSDGYEHFFENSPVQFVFRFKALQV